MSSSHSCKIYPQTRQKCLWSQENLPPQNPFCFVLSHQHMKKNFRKTKSMKITSKKIVQLISLRLFFCNINLFSCIFRAFHSFTKIQQNIFYPVWTFKCISHSTDFFTLDYFRNVRKRETDERWTHFKDS